LVDFAGLVVADGAEWPEQQDREMLKPKFAYRPLVEILESRLQPGSLLTTQAYGWSLLADSLSILNQESKEPARLSSESSNRLLSSAPADEHHGSLPIAVASPASGHSDRPLTNDLVNSLVGGLPKEDPLTGSLTGRGNSIPLAAVATPPLQQPPPATPLGSVPQSPLGVAAPVPVATSIAVTGPSLLGSTTGLQAVPTEMTPLGSGTVFSFTGYQASNDLHAVPLDLGNGASHVGGNAGNQAALNFLSYLGASGPDAINSIAVRNENGANFIYVVGALTDSSGRTDVFAAKLSDGATAAVWAETLPLATPGPDSAFGLALNDGHVYLAGSVADPSVTAQSDGLIAQLDSGTGAILSSGVLANASLAAITLDPSGNVYADGWIPDPLNANRQDLALIKATNDLSTTIYNAGLRLKYISGPDANTSVTSGGGLIVDGQGDIYYAGSVSKVGDPNNDIAPLFGWLTDTRGTPLRQKEWTTPNPDLGPNGKGTAVAFDPNTGNVVFTGSLNINGGTPLNQDLVLGRMQTSALDPLGRTVKVFLPLTHYRWYVDDRTADHNRAGDWTGNGLVVLPDGSTIVTGAAYDPVAPSNPPLSMPTSGIDVHMTHFLASDSATPDAGLLDADPENVFGGSGTDQGYAVSRDPTNANNVYVVGSTTSIDLLTTPGVFEPTYVGSTSTGFVGQASIV
jgi:hypothetical protein